MEKRDVDARKRKALLVMPILVIPFLALFFWALGGGKGKGKGAAAGQQSALNTNLPSAVLDEGKTMDKMSLYEQARRDSLKKKEREQYDPLSEWISGSSQDASSGGSSYPAHEGNPFSAWSPSGALPAATGQGDTDPNSLAVEAKLNQLEKLLADSSRDTLAMLDEGSTENPADDLTMRSLDSIMQAINDDASAEDPEMARMDEMLSKILDIQHPSRVRERIAEASRRDKGTVFPVQTSSRQEVVNDLLPPPLASKDTIRAGGRDSVILPVYSAPNQFYNLTGEQLDAAPAVNAITAVVHQTQTLLSGATVKFRLTRDIYIAGQLIPKGSFVYGTGSLSGERLTCQINQIHYREAVFPVSLTVYDATDGLEGIYMPGAIGRDAAKKGTDDAIQSLGLATLDPNIGTQAAAAGIETVKSFLSKKTKLVRLTLKADHPVLLVDDRQMNQ